jgi:hypothetical protein
MPAAQIDFALRHLQICSINQAAAKRAWDIGHSRCIRKAWVAPGVPVARSVTFPEAGNVPAE